MKLLDCFPTGYTPRTAQVEIIQSIQHALDEDKRFIIVQAPPGCGKSCISAALVNYSSDPSAEWRDKVSNNMLLSKSKDGTYNEASNEERCGAYVLTTTKYLQDQYEQMFSDRYVLKGKANYDCDLEPMFNVSVAPCVLTPKLIDKCIFNKGCSYYNALNDMLSNKFRITNYSKYITLPEPARFCDILICDEASEIEETIVNYFSLSVNYKRLYSLGLRGINPVNSDKKKEIIQWLKEVKQEADIIYRELSDNIRESIYSPQTNVDLSKLSGLKNLIDQSQLIIDNWSFCDYIIERSVDQVRITPLRIDKLMDRLFAGANKVVFLSSTIFDVKCFTKTLGITDYKYIEHPGVFNSTKSPIYAPCKVSLNRKNLKQSIPIILKQINDICNMFPDDKGVIHTHTNDITTILHKHFRKNNRFLFRVGDITNENILLDHKSSDDPTILVSPSLAFGIDLPDELCRFQIIVKLPYPSLGDKRVNKLSKESPDWYTSKMFTKLIQMSGRGTRNVEDYSTTFVLDGNFIRSVSYNIDKLPEHFRSRLQ